MKKLFLLCAVLIGNCTATQIDTPNNHTLPSFDKAMSAAPKYGRAYTHILKNKSEAAFVEKVRARYNALTTQWPWQESPKIPKIIHQIWVGPNPMPHTFKVWQQTWLDLHPDWQYKLWTDADVKDLRLVNQKLYDTTSSYGEKANILRYEILHKYGGVYLDTDFEGIQTLDFIHHTCDFYAGFEFPQPNKEFLIIGNAIIGSCPGHPLLKLFITEMKNHWHHDWQPKRSGTFFVTEIIKQHISEMPLGTVIFPANFFYPWANTKLPWETRDSSYRDIECPESIGFHHWDLTWQKKSRFRSKIGHS